MHERKETFNYYKTHINVMLEPFVIYRIFAKYNKIHILILFLKKVIELVLKNRVVDFFSITSKSGIESYMWFLNYILEVFFNVNTLSSLCN